MGIIGLLTDFGINDHFVGSIKAVIKNKNPLAEIIDISHDVKSFSIVNAQFMLYASFRYFPKGTVFCIIVDPGVGTDRKIIIAKDEFYTFIVPDNGIISAVESEAMSYFSVHTEYYNNVAATFHGRDVFAPIAAVLSGGSNPENFADRTYETVHQTFPEYKLEKDSIKGFVLHVDRFGNVITSIPNGIMTEIMNYSVVEFKGNIINTCKCRTYGQLEDGQAGILEGSAGSMELALKEESFANRYSMDIGDSIKILTHV